MTSRLVPPALLLRLLFVFIAFSLLDGCGSGSSTSVPSSGASGQLPITITVFSNPVPAGSAAFMGVAIGTNFTATSAVFFNSTQLLTSYQTSTILNAQVPASVLTTPGTATVTVKDTATGLTSNSLTFAILSPAAVGATVVDLISSAADGTPGNGDSLVQPSISTTGRFVAFQSNATNLVPQQVITPWENIFLADTCIGAPSGCTPSTQLVSISSDGSTGGNAQSRDSTVSADGRYVVFDSQATNIVPNTPSFCPTQNCIFLRDTCIGALAGCTPQTSLAAIFQNGPSAGGGLPAINSTGRYLTFDSNIVLPLQVYLRDECVGAPAGCVPATTLISVNSAGANGNQGSTPQSLSDDGRFVGFASYATNLIDTSAPDVQGSAHMFVKDTCLGSTVPCTPTITQVDLPNSGGAPNNQLDYEAIPSLSSNGRYVAYSSNATNLVAQTVIGGNVYLRDTCFGATGCTPANTLVSVGNDGSIGNAGSHQQTMSADGRYIAFTSIATNLVYGIPYAAGTWQDIYVRDTCTGAPTGCYPSTVRVAVTNSPNLQQPSSAGGSFPVISADGHHVAFISSSTNLTPAGTGGHAQVFLSKTGF